MVLFFWALWVSAVALHQIALHLLPREVLLIGIIQLRLTDVHSGGLCLSFERRPGLKSKTP
jgi:hypothetical protein